MWSRPSRKIRKIVVDGVEYTWQVGASCVIIRGPDRFKRTPSHVEAAGHYFAERAFEKGNASIYPHMIETYIRIEVEKDRW